jgi:signal transduction histidine kinase
VFGKLAAIMLVMAFLLMLITTGFFIALVQPTLHGEISPGVAHAWLLVLSLLVMSGVVLTTQVVLQKMLRPLRILTDGVTRLGEGELGVTVPRTTTDEFGRLTDTFNLMAGRVREMITARDRLLIDVSHELRSPLTRMKVALELMPDDVQRARLSSEVAEMERLISGLLELERLRTGRGVTLVRQDIVPILREVVATYEDRAPGVRFSTDAGRRAAQKRDAKSARERAEVLVGGQQGDTSDRRSARRRCARARYRRWRRRAEGGRGTDFRAVFPGGPVAVEGKRWVRPWTEHLQAGDGGAQRTDHARTRQRAGFDVRAPFSAPTVA